MITYFGTAFTESFETPVTGKIDRSDQWVSEKLADGASLEDICQMDAERIFGENTVILYTEEK